MHEKELEHYHPIAITSRILLAVMCILVLVAKIFGPILFRIGGKTLFNMMYALIATGLIDMWVVVSFAEFSNTFHRREYNKLIMFGIPCA